MALMQMAYDAPQVFRQLFYDMQLARFEAKQDEAGGDGEWRRSGESIGQARDRLREEREAAKRALAEKGVE